jgi:hypothetical protein
MKHMMNKHKWRTTKPKQGGGKMFGQLNKKAWSGVILLVVIGVFVFSGIANAGVVSAYELRTQAAAKKAEMPEEIKEALKPEVKEPQFHIPVQPSSNFASGYEPVNPEYIEEGMEFRAAVMTSVLLTESGLRGEALDKIEYKGKMTKVSDIIDGMAKDIYAEEAKLADLILAVMVSEGFGRDKVAESLKAKDAIFPDELLGEVDAIKTAIDAGLPTYLSKSGKTYKIKYAIIDVVEGTKRTKDNVYGKKLHELPGYESGGTSIILTGNDKLLGCCPDVYGHLVLFKAAKGQEVTALDPEEIAKDPAKVESFLTRIMATMGQGVTFNDLEIVIMDRPRETQILAELKRLQGVNKGLEISQIKDGTVVPCLLAALGRKTGKQIVFMSVGGLPEVSFSTSIAALFKDEGAVAFFRKYSENVAKNRNAKDAFKMINKIDLNAEEIKELGNKNPVEYLNKLTEIARKRTTGSLEGKDIWDEIAKSELTETEKQELGNITPKDYLDKVAGIMGKRTGLPFDGKDAVNMDRRYDYSDEELVDMGLDPKDPNAVAEAGKLMTFKEVQGANNIEADVAFITHNGFFKKNGVEKTADNIHKVTVLRIASINGKPAAWPVEKVIDSTKDESENFNSSPVLSDKPLVSFADTKAVKDALKGIVKFTLGGVKVVDQKQLRDHLIDNLVYDATYNPNKEVVELCRNLIRDIAAAQGAVATLYLNPFYQEMLNKKEPFTLATMNIRGTAYNTSQAMFLSAKANKVGFVIPEIAGKPGEGRKDSEIGYSDQAPKEFVTSILAAAIKTGYDRPVFFQGDHFQVNASLYKKDPAKAMVEIKALIREGIEGGFLQIDLDMSTAVDWEKTTAEEKQVLNHKLTAELSAYVRQLERELGLDQRGIVVNLGGEIGEIGKDQVAKGLGGNSNAKELRAYWKGYIRDLVKFGHEAGYMILPISKCAVNIGTKHGGIRNPQGQLKDAALDLNALAECSKCATEELPQLTLDTLDELNRESPELFSRVSLQEYKDFYRNYRLVMVVHGFSTVDRRCYQIVAGKGVPEGFEVDPKLGTPESIEILKQHPAREAHLATSIQDRIILVVSELAKKPQYAYLRPKLAELREWVLKNSPKPDPAKGQTEDGIYVDNRKKAWKPFKNWFWNLPDDVRQAIVEGLVPEFSSMFTSLQLNDTENFIPELKKLAAAQYAATTAKKLKIEQSLLENGMAAETKIDTAKKGDYLDEFINNTEAEVALGTELKKDRALIISADYIKESGMKSISRIANLRDTQLIIAGKDADRIIEVLGLYGVNKKDVMTAENTNKALEVTKNLGIEASKIAILLTPAEEKAASLPEEIAGVISANGLVPAEELAMAIYALHKTDANEQALTSLHEKVAKDVITAETKQDLSKMLLDLEEGSVKFSDNMNLAENVSQDIAQAKQADQQLKDAI